MGETSQDSGAMTGLVRAVGSMLGVHIQYAQREAKNDVGRVISGAILLVFAVAVAMFAVLFAQAAAVIWLAKLPSLNWITAAFVVAGVDLAVALVLTLAARAKLKRPVLAETRTLVKRTVESFADV